MRSRFSAASHCASGIVGRAIRAVPTGAVRATRVASAAIACAALLAALPARAQLPYCNTLPLGEQSAARQYGRCVEPPARAATPAARRAAVPTAAPVPSVIGASAADALERLRGFRVERRDVPSVRKAGEVIDQEPRPPAQRPAGSAVRIDVSDGSRVLVPPVRNRQLADARARLGANGLVAEIREQPSDEAPGLVSGQEPPEGTEVARGASVTLTVSSGLVVPDVRGELLAEARRRLARFAVEQLEVQSGELKGAVVEQDPAPGVRVAAATRVRLNISDGSLVVVPDLQSVSLGAARATLREAGLTVTVRGWPEHADAVIKTQTPAPRAVVARGAMVQLEVRPPTLWYAAGWILFALAAALGIWWVRSRPESAGAASPVPSGAPDASAVQVAATPPVRVVAGLADPGRSRIDGGVSSGPNVRIATRVDQGAAEVKLDYELRGAPRRDGGTPNDSTPHDSAPHDRKPDGGRHDDGERR